ncbi:hypothetical protein D3C75_1267410 [compost metagenome]
MLQREFKQAVFRPVRQEHIVTNLEVMLPSRRLANLCHHIELPTQKALLLLNTLIVKTHPAFHQPVQLVQELPHHPLTERRIKQL